MKPTLLILLLLLLSLSSCNNEEVVNNEKITKVEFKTQPLSINDVVSIANRLEKANLVTNSLGGQRVIQKSNEEEIQEIIASLIENGKQLYAEMISQIKKTDEWNNLSEIEKSEILQFV